MFSVKSRAPRDCQANIYLVVSRKSAKFEYEPYMPPIGTLLQLFVVFLVGNLDAGHILCFCV